MLKISFYLLLVFILLSCNEVSEEEIKGKLNHYLIGVTQYKASDFNNAITSFKEDYKRTKNLNSLFKLAEISVITNDPHNAEAYLKQILKRDNKNNRAKYELALLYKKMGRYDKSLSNFSKLLDDKIFLDDSYYHVIDIYLYSEELKEATLLFNTGLDKIVKKYEIEYLFVAFLYDRDKKLYKKYFDDILNNSKSYKVLNKLVKLLLSKDDIDETFKVLKKLEIYYPKDALTLSLLGQIFLRREKFSEAKKYFERAELLDKRNLVNKINLATSEIYSNNLVKAEHYLKEAIGIRADSIKSLLLMGFLYYLNNDMEKSDKIIETVKKNTLQTQLKSHRLNNQIIDFYLINVMMDKEGSLPSKSKISNFITGKNTKLIYLKAKRLNQMGLYSDVKKLYSTIKDNLGDDFLKEVIIANIFLKDKKATYDLLEKLKKEKDIYRVWADYYFDKKCIGLDEKFKLHKNNNIFIDIYTTCLIKEKKLKLAKKVINDFVNENKLSETTIEYLKKKIIVINYNLIQQQ